MCWTVFHQTPFSEIQTFNLFQLGVGEECWDLSYEFERDFAGSDSAISVKSFSSEYSDEELRGVETESSRFVISAFDIGQPINH